MLFLQKNDFDVVGSFFLGILIFFDYKLTHFVLLRFLALAAGGATLSF